MRHRSAVSLIAMVVVVGARAAGAAGQVAPPSPAPPAPKAAPVARPRQAPAVQPKPHAPGDVEVEPIACWWKTDRNAVHVGERFTVTLTCSFVETTAIKIVPDLNQLEPTTVALQPFEVVNGIRHEDIRTPPWRYIQYEYTTRIIGDTFFGKDVDIPGVKVTYHVQSSIGGGSAGRDQTYGLPPLAMRVNSLVPKKAADIRDTSPDTFADIETRRLRSTGELVAAAISFGFAVVLVGLAFVRVVGRYRVRTPAAVRPLPLGFVLGGCVRAAKTVKEEVARDGWTGELAGRALTVFRIASAVALGRPVAQDIVDRNIEAREGQLALRKGFLRRKHAMVSTSTTPGTIARTLGHANATRTNARTQMLLADLSEAMVVLRAARYGRNGQLDTTALDAALESGTDALKKLRVAKLWPMRAAGALAKSAADVGGLVWSR
jgi:hypothetical protein